ncbi:hypothetical protein AAHE18_18G098600 [Arachis hypogaea]
MLLVVALIPLYLWKRSQDSQPHPHADEPVQAPRREAVVRPAGNRRMRRRPAASGASTRQLRLQLPKVCCTFGSS